MDRLLSESITGPGGCLPRVLRPDIPIIIFNGCSVLITESEARGTRTALG
jgi:hypothetical protein